MTDMASMASIGRKRSRGEDEKEEEEEEHHHPEHPEHPDHGDGGGGGGGGVGVGSSAAKTPTPIESIKVVGTGAVPYRPLAVCFATSALGEVGSDRCLGGGFVMEVAEEVVGRLFDDHLRPFLMVKDKLGFKEVAAARAVWVELMALLRSPEWVEAVKAWGCTPIIHMYGCDGSGAVSGSGSSLSPAMTAMLEPLTLKFVARDQAVFHLEKSLFGTLPDSNSNATKDLRCVVPRVRAVAHILVCHEFL